MSWQLIELESPKETLWHGIDRVQRRVLVEGEIKTANDLLGLSINNYIHVGIPLIPRSRPIFAQLHYSSEWGKVLTDLHQDPSNVMHGTLHINQVRDVVDKGIFHVSKFDDSLIWALQAIYLSIHHSLVIPHYCTVNDRTLFIKSQPLPSQGKKHI